jgi:cold shock CspA family protein
VFVKDVSIVNTGSSRVPFGGGFSSNNSTSSKFGFGGSSRSPQSSFDFGGNRASRSRFGDEDSTSTEKPFRFNRGLSNSRTDSLFSSEKTSTDDNQKREMGSVKRWTFDRGFGFIRRANGGSDLFCHARSLKDGLRALEEVISNQLLDEEKKIILSFFLSTGSNS